MIFPPGGMMDLSTTTNGYQQSHSPNGLPESPSPGLINKSMAKHSPPPGVTRPNLRVVIPNSRGDIPVSEPHAGDPPPLEPQQPHQAQQQTEQAPLDDQVSLSKVQHPK